MNFAERFGSPAVAAKNLLIRSSAAQLPTKSLTTAVMAFLPPSRLNRLSAFAGSADAVTDALGAALIAVSADGVGVGAGIALALSTVGVTGGFASSPPPPQAT